MYKIECGLAKDDITPSNSIFMDGFAVREGPSMGIADPLYVKAAAFKSGESVFLLFSFDAIGLPEKIANSIKTALSKELHINRSHIMLCATHTHSAPVAGILKDLKVDKNYWNRVKGIAVRTGASALSSFKPVKLDVVNGETMIGINRRQITDNGIIIGENPNGYVDRMVRVIRIYGADDVLMGLIVHASCHPVNLGGKNRYISADYPGQLYMHIKENNPNVTVLFLNGGAGDVNPRFNKSESPEEALKRNGMAISEEVLRIVNAPFTEKDYKPVLSVYYKRLQVPLKELPSLKYLHSQAETYLEKYNKASDDVERYINKRFCNWYKKAIKDRDKVNNHPYINVPLQIFLLCEGVVLVGLPFEVFSSTTRKIVDLLCELGFDRNSVFVCGYSNGAYSYLAPSTALLEGGYEAEESYIWYGLPNQYSNDAEECVCLSCRDAVARLIKK